ncbi:secondary thiamine-phosphate synthase enzyme YjbQ [Litoribrevibacter euphylliae]|uniref:Secondary thiamine-phosphate synthase enzyme YjbQ n=1 Tax=Litoribrevibacter euphylliae TaxID=1834034 RepID=A0ABV7HG71_9GAMM
MWSQKEIKLSAKSRGFHLVTDEIVKSIQNEIGSYQIGLLNLFIQHTSASLTINENCDPSVRSDMEKHFNVMVPENAPYYEHTYEGADDMPAHLKTVLVGPSLIIPITSGRLALGTWQGIYLGEHRDHGGSRRIIATVQGQ